MSRAEEESLPFDDTLILDDLAPTLTPSSRNSRLVLQDFDRSIQKNGVSMPPSNARSSSPPANPPETSVQVIDNGGISDFRKYVTVGVLFFVNLLNYMDRFTIAGILPKVKEHFVKADGSHIEDADAGLLQAIFIVGYMIFSPVFGYAGDRYNRKYLMLGGIFFWSGITFASSFVPGNYFWLFVILRALVGVGEASYSTIAPTLISDMFVTERRSMMLMIFYFAIPVGSGLGYIVGSSIVNVTGTWSSALQVTPGLGVLCCLLIFFVTKEPPRGMAEGAVHHSSNSSIWEDILQLVKNKTFMLTTFGFTCVAFVAGALALFAPQTMIDAYRMSGVSEDATSDAEISFLFGVVTCASGFLGVALGSVSSTYIKRRHKNGDALVCAFGLITSAPFFYVGLNIVSVSLQAAWVFIFIGETLVFLNWALVADMLLYTVIPTRRSAAEAMQIFLSHLLGDAGSPYLCGVISDQIRGDGTTYEEKFRSMQYSLFICAFVAVLGGGLFLFASLFIAEDRAKAEAITKGLSEDSSSKRSRTEDRAPLMDEEYSDDDVQMISA